MKQQKQITHESEPDDEQTAEDTVNAVRSDSAANFVINIEVEDTDCMDKEPKFKPQKPSFEEDKRLMDEEVKKNWISKCEEVVSVMES